MADETNITDGPLTLDEAVKMLFADDDQGEGEAARTEQNAQALDRALADVHDQGAGALAAGNVGLGVDIVEIERMARIIERSPAFAERVFTDDERAYCEGTAVPAVHYALRFAAREAVVKALGTGFSCGIGVRDVEVRRASNGRPFVRLSGAARRIAAEQGVRELPLSLSYTHSEAVACALAITEQSVAETEKRKDPKEELARKFKETRSLLDEI